MDEYDVGNEELAQLVAMTSADTDDTDSDSETETTLPEERGTAVGADSLSESSSNTLNVSYNNRKILVIMSFLIRSLLIEIWSGTRLQITIIINFQLNNLTEVFGFPSLGLFLITINYAHLLKAKPYC